MTFAHLTDLFVLLDGSTSVYFLHIMSNRQSFSRCCSLYTYLHIRLYCVALMRTLIFTNEQQFSVLNTVKIYNECKWSLIHFKQLVAPSFIRKMHYDKGWRENALKEAFNSSEKITSLSTRSANERDEVEENKTFPQGV